MIEKMCKKIIAWKSATQSIKTVAFKNYFPQNGIFKHKAQL